MKILNLSKSRKVSYEEYGDPNGYPVFMLHGTPGSHLLAQVFEVSAKQEGVRIIAPDRSGYGLSSPVSYQLLDYPDQIIEIADLLGVEKFALLGASGGTIPALACAYKLSRVAAVGLVSTLGPLSRYDVSGEMIAMNRILMCRIARYAPSLAAILLQLMTRFSLYSARKHLENGTSPSPEMAPDLFALIMNYSGEAFRTGYHGTAYDFRNLWQNWGFELADIKTPVYIWHGEADNLAPVAMARYLVDQIPDCTATFYPGEDHLQPILNHMAEILTKVKEPFAHFVPTASNNRR